MSSMEPHIITPRYDFLHLLSVPRAIMLNGATGEIMRLSRVTGATGMFNISIEEDGDYTFYGVLLILEPDTAFMYSDDPQYPEVRTLRLRDWYIADYF